MEALRTRCTAGMEAFFEATKKKIQKPWLPDRVGQYRTRLEEELAVAERMGIQTYLLNIAEIVKMARDGKVPIGDGRESCVNSLLCFTLDITRINPVADGLPYEVS
jgi:DNA polymerase-3 subunit alpha